uniref:Uncharacterized protein n=1 Tax=Arundo donax TaxID=35708 RepID=A0A0A8YSP3_ARUDO
MWSLFKISSLVD